VNVIKSKFNCCVNFNTYLNSEQRLRKINCKAVVKFITICYNRLLGILGNNELEIMWLEELFA